MMKAIRKVAKRRGQKVKLVKKLGGPFNAKIYKIS